MARNLIGTKILYFEIFFYKLDKKIKFYYYISFLLKCKKFFEFYKKFFMNFKKNNLILQLD